MLGMPVARTRWIPTSIWLIAGSSVGERSLGFEIRIGKLGSKCFIGLNELSQLPRRCGVRDGRWATLRLCRGQSLTMTDFFFRAGVPCECRGVVFALSKSLGLAAILAGSCSLRKLSLGNGSWNVRKQAAHAASIKDWQDASHEK
jgi:hypothetical protein